MGTYYSQVVVARPPRLSWVENQLSQEFSDSQTASDLSGDSHKLSANESLGTPHPLRVFQKMLSLMAVASSVISLGLLHMRPLQYWVEMMTVCLALKSFLPALKEHHVLVHSDNMKIGSLYQPPRRPQIMFPLEDDTMFPALGTEKTPLTTRGSCVRQTETGSRYVIQRQSSSREWRLDPQTVQMIWSVFGRV